MEDTRRHNDLGFEIAITKFSDGCRVYSLSSLSCMEKEARYYIFVIQRRMLHSYP
jgi:hypothetical protein